MSDFWVASDPPKSADITAWCEAEVETACRDLMGAVRIVDACRNVDVEGDGEGFIVGVLLNSPWDDYLKESEIDVCKLMRLAAESITCHMHNPALAGIYADHHGRALESRLAAVEATIAEIRKTYRQTESPEAELIPS